MKILKTKNEKTTKDAISENKKFKSDKLAEILSFPQGTFRNFPTIQIRGNREITIDGCSGLISYDPAQILLETKYCRICIIGKTMTLNNLTGNVLAVRGFIRNVEFTM